MLSSRAASLPFIKMHGLGNDFIVIDGLSGGLNARARGRKWLTPARIRELCDRRLGIGADQVLWIKPARSKRAVAAMEVFNADGSMAEMCGNGLRAVALYLDGELPRKVGRKNRDSSYLIETGAGLLRVETSGKFARVEMGVPAIGSVAKLRLSETEIEFTPVCLANPHAVVFVEDLGRYPVEELGPGIERHPIFPNRTNVEFARAKDKRTLIVRFWERGAGLTLACGTGACASAVAAIASGRCVSPVEVRLPGGNLRIEWGGDGESVWMTGPAVEVFRGEWSGV